MTAAELDALGEAFAVPALAYGLNLAKEHPGAWVFDRETDTRWALDEWVYAYPGGGAVQALERALAGDGRIDERFEVQR